MNNMKMTAQVLNIGFGSMEGTAWAKAEILDGNVEYVDDGQRFFKGSKTAKLNIVTENDFQLVRRFSRETFPADFELMVDMQVVGGKPTLKVLDFKSNEQK